MGRDQERRRRRKLSSREGKEGDRMGLFMNQSF